MIRKTRLRTAQNHRAARDDRFQLRRHSREWSLDRPGWTSAGARSRMASGSSDPTWYVLHRPRPLASTTSSIPPCPKWSLPPGLPLHGLARPPQHHEARRLLGTVGCGSGCICSARTRAGSRQERRYASIISLAQRNRLN